MDTSKNLKKQAGLSARLAVKDAETVLRQGRRIAKAQELALKKVHGTMTRVIESRDRVLEDIRKIENATFLGTAMRAVSSERGSSINLELVKNRLRTFFGLRKPLAKMASERESGAKTTRQARR